MASATYRPPPPGPLNELLRFIDHNLQGDLSLAMLSGRAQLGPRQLHRAFVAATGLAPRAYVERRRVEAAARMLEVETLSLREIGSQCGFSNGATFARAFRRAFGATPARYRAGLHVQRSW